MENVHVCGTLGSEYMVAWRHYLGPGVKVDIDCKSKEGSNNKIIAGFWDMRQAGLAIETSMEA